ncbi:MAG: glycosyltransferase family 25 protein [Pontixanthobacter sp.]
MTTALSNLAITVLSLPKDSARRARLRRDMGMAANGLNFHTPPSLEAVRAWKDQPDTHHRPGMTDGEISCALGHLAMQKNALASNAPFLILEDDARYEKHAPIAELAKILCRTHDLVLFGITTKKQFLGGCRSDVLGYRVLDMDRISIRYLRGALAYSAPEHTLRALIRHQSESLDHADSWGRFYRAKIIRRIAVVDLFDHGDDGVSNLEEERLQDRPTSRARKLLKRPLLAGLRAARRLVGRHNLV